MASAHSATLPPPSTPKSPSPDPGATLQGNMDGEDTPRRRQQAQEASLLPSGDHPTSDGTHTRHGPLRPGMSVPPSSNHHTEPMLETLHKHSDTRLKITAHHPRTYKTSRGLILPTELYYALTNIKDLEKKIGVRTKRSKQKHILGIEHRNIPIQLDLWSKEVIFRETDKQHYTDTRTR